MPTAPQTVSPALAALVRKLRDIVKPGQDTELTALRAAAALLTSIRDENLLTPEQSEPDLHKVRQQVLHVEPDGAFSIASLIVLPGQTTPIHDFGAWCVSGVYVGQEREVLFDHARPGQEGLTQRAARENPAGAVAMVTPPGDIRRIESGFRGVTISIQIYGGDMSVPQAMVQRTYDLPITG